MSEKELLYIEDTLGHLTNMQDFITANIDLVQDENYLDILEKIEELNKIMYKKFYKLIEG